MLACPRAILFLLALAWAGGLTLSGQEPQESESATAEPAATEAADAALSPAARLGKFYWEEARRAMTTELQRLDNYSCVHHINRYRWPPRGNGFERVDTVRLQVSYVGGQEYFARLGSPFMVTDPREIVSTGMLASGFFKGFVGSVFINQAIENLVFRGVQSGPEQEFYRFQFETGESNPVRVRIGTAIQAVPGKGELWLDKEDQRLRRIVIENREGLGRTMKLRRVLSVMDWAPVTTSRGDVLLPQRADLWMVDSDGGISRNEVTLAQCREYRAESSIRFDSDEENDALTEELRTASEDIDEADAPLVSFATLGVGGTTGSAVGLAMPIAASRLLPEGLTVSTALLEPLVLEGLRVGKTFPARVEAAVVHQGRTLLPAGTLVEGRVRRLDRYRSPVPHTVLWLEFPVVRHEAEEYTFLADVVRVSNVEGLANNNAVFQQQVRERNPSTSNFLALEGPEPGYKPVAGIVSYVFRDEPASLPAGHSITWKTIKGD